MSFTKEDRAAILEALNKVKASIENVPKDGTNPHFGYRYVSEASLNRAVRASMIENGLILIPSVVPDWPIRIDEKGVTHVLFEYQVAHVSGAVWPETIRVYGQGNDRDSKGGWGDKGAYKASTGAYKYLLLRLLQIDTGDDPELDHLDDSSKMAPRKRPEEDQRDAEPPAHEDENQALPEDDDGPGVDLKAAGIYREAFKAVESVYGAGATNDTQKKFKALDWALATMGLRVTKQIRTQDQAKMLVTLIRQWAKANKK